MRKSAFAMIAGVVLLAATGAQAGSYPFGDEPYTLNWGYYPQIQSGCWRWNWQQYLYNDYCAVYVHPKAYMYPRSSRVVIRAKG